MRRESELKTAERASRENTFGIEFIQRKEGENCKALTDMARTLKQQVALRNLFDNEKGEK